MYAASGNNPGMGDPADVSIARIDHSRQSCAEKRDGWARRLPACDVETGAGFVAVMIGKRSRCCAMAEELRREKNSLAALMRYSKKHVQAHCS
jgi:hypothetical protein